jgi:hypothetical protein
MARVGAVSTAITICKPPRRADSDTPQSYVRTSSIRRNGAGLILSSRQHGTSTLIDCLRLQHRASATVCDGL